MHKKIFGRMLVTVIVLLLLGLVEGGPMALPRAERMVLENRLIVLFSEDHSLPFVTLQLLVDSGSWRDPIGEEGLSHLTAKGMLLGTSNRSANIINETLDFTGTSLSASSNRDYTAVGLRVLKRNLDTGLDLLIEILTEPAFPEAEIQKEVRKTLAAIQSAEDEPDEVAEKAFHKALFLKGPYDHPTEGTKESLPRIRRDGLLQFYQAYYHPNNAILTVVGDLTRDEIKTKIISRFEKWPVGKVPDTSVTNRFAQDRQSIKIDRSITQANIIIGHRGVSRDNPDYYAITVMNYVLGGGGFSSRLMEEIRNKRGLAYSVASFFDPGKYPGSFQIVLQTKNASAREAISLSLNEMERIQKEGVSEKELDGAKKYLIGSFPMRLDTQGKLTNFLSQVEYYGLGLNYPEKYPSLVRSVSREDVKRVAQKYLYPRDPILVIVGNLKEAGMESP
jgi:zinc protease